MPILHRITPILRQALRGKRPLALASIAAATAALAAAIGSDANSNVAPQVASSPIPHEAAPVVIARATDTAPIVAQHQPWAQAPRTPVPPRRSADTDAAQVIQSTPSSEYPAFTASAGDASVETGSASPLSQVELPRVYAIQVTEPSDIDADGNQASASQPPATAKAPAAGLQPRQPPSGSSMSPGGGDAGQGGGIVTAAASTTVTVYTPAQIRQAYGFATLPAATSANKGVYQGAGQTIVIIDAYHAATAGNDINVFSAKFGLPGCKLLASSYQNGANPAALLTPAQASDGCVFQTLYVNSSGSASTMAPAANDDWATETSLDVQWAHAIAPLAKIVLVEAASSSGNDILKAMQFAGQLGANVISMSYGSTETSQSPSLDSAITGNATWVASSGDSGAGVMWPAVSRNVLAVGGTLLSNVSPRAESAWSGSSGGLSRYVHMPTWQSAVSVPGNPANTAANASRMYRGVPDVAYDASPYSGFYVVRNGTWWSIGGTSAGAPQWAALVAVLNGARALSGKTAYTGTAVQQALYGVGAASANYRAAFLDITSGSNGSCGTCAATTGYDLVTGLGTPNVPGLLNALTSVR